MTRDEALTMALEIIKATNASSQFWLVPDSNLNKAVIAIKEALAQQEQEPVAWRTFDGEGGYDYRAYEMNENYDDEWAERNPKHKGWVEPLFTSPPQREWVGLTDDEIKAIVGPWGSTEIKGYTRKLFDQIEAALKEKNT